MAIKSRNKRVGLCLMVVAGCVVLAASSVTADTCPIVDGDVIPFGIPPESPNVDRSWDQSQSGLVVERGDGFVDIGLPAAQRDAFGQWGIHGSITFDGAVITTIKDWDNSGALVEMNGHVRYGLEGGDDGVANIGTEEFPVTNNDEVDWGINSVEFWLATGGARDCFRIELTSSGPAFMKIDYIDGYRVDNEQYGLGLTSPDDTRHYGEWIPLNYLCNVPIDIKPGSFPNSINPNAGGVIPVAILSTDDFDASIVDPQTVALEGAGARGKGKSGRYGSMEDVDGDGDLDLVVQVVNEIGWAENATEATLTGFTWDGIPIQGTDTVNIVPPDE